MSSTKPEAIHSSQQVSRNARLPDWKREYLATLREFDSAKLSTRVAAAEAAIFTRLQALSPSYDGDVERKAIQGALTVLRVIKRDHLDFPDWESGRDLFL
jgi:hypothetical protein